MSAIGFLSKIRKIIFKTDQQRTFNKWFSSEGDTTFSLDYPLNQKSVVLDVGGYKGQWTSDIFSRFLCKVYLFEPVKEFADFSRDRFVHNKKIIIFDFGLSGITRKEDISLRNDESSLLLPGEKRSIELKSLREFLNEKKIKEVDLISINIEGGEYELLEKILEEDMITRFKNIQIQFHRIGTDYNKKRDDIRKRLSETHKQKYCFPWVWEAWTKK